MPSVLQYDYNFAEVEQSAESFDAHMKDVSSWLAAHWFKRDSDIFQSLPPILIDYPLDHNLDSRE
eukprot:196683-Prymnesium_polylepis.1